MEEKVRKLIEKEVNKLGISIDSIIYEKEGSNYTMILRVVDLPHPEGPRSVINSLFLI